MIRYIFKHKMKEAQTHAFIAAWQRGSGIIQACHGALGTRLFEDLNENNIWYAIADWDSLEARSKAMEKLKKQANAHLLTDHERFTESSVTVAVLELYAESLPN